MRLIDQQRFEEAGGYGCSNSGFVLERLTCCGAVVVEDDELSWIFVDPTDLSKRVSLLREAADVSPLPCPLCGALEWATVEITHVTDVPAKWIWVCNQA
jgi:hypothetical protein